MRRVFSKPRRCACHDMVQYTVAMMTKVDKKTTVRPRNVFAAYRSSEQNGSRTPEPVWLFARLFPDRLQLLLAARQASILCCCCIRMP